MTLCPECAQEISGKAARCPHCGHPLRMGCLGKFLIAVVVFVAAIVAWLVKLYWEFNESIGDHSFLDRWIDSLNSL